MNKADNARLFLATIRSVVLPFARGQSNVRLPGVDVLLQVALIATEDDTVLEYPVERALSFVAELEGSDWDIPLWAKYGSRDIRNTTLTAGEKFAWMATMMLDLTLIEIDQEQHIPALELQRIQEMSEALDGNEGTGALCDLAYELVDSLKLRLGVI